MLKKPLALSLPILVAFAAAACEESDPPEVGAGTGQVPDETPAVVSADPPPPLSGGTLLVTKDAAYAVVADPDRDRVQVVDLGTKSVLDVVLREGDEPGRSVEDAAGRVHVALRRGGAVLTIDPATGDILARRAVCGAPRGIAYDDANDKLVVACASGELVKLGASELGGADVESRYLEPDLRDVAIVGGEIWVSHLRGSEVLRLDAAGAILRRQRPAEVVAVNLNGVERRHEASTAWRMVPLPDGRAALSHQYARSSEIVLDDPSDPGGEPAYGSFDCNDRLVRSAITVLGKDAAPTTMVPTTITNNILPVDLSVSRNGERLATIDASANSVTEYSVAALSPDVPCDGVGGETLSGAASTHPVALSYAALHDLWVQTREPARLERYRDGAFIDAIELGGPSRADTGYDLFHDVDAVAFSGLACASCHPEGRDDGHVWSFAEVGPRRSQSLAGTLKGTAPFHWEGDLATMGDLMSEVFVKRMGGMPQSDERVAALQGWLESLEAVRVSSAAAPAAAVARGQALFESTAVACATCHSGPALTNNTSVAVGTGAKLQVPSLIGVGLRAPLMHDGCAPSLMARFDAACGGGDAHGKTSQLSQAQLEDLVAYMNTL